MSLRNKVSIFMEGRDLELAYSQYYNDLFPGVIDESQLYSECIPDGFMRDSENMEFIQSVVNTFWNSGDYDIEDLMEIEELELPLVQYFVHGIVAGKEKECVYGLDYLTIEDVLIDIVDKNRYIDGTYIGHTIVDVVMDNFDDIVKVY